MRQGKLIEKGSCQTADKEKVYGKHRERGERERGKGRETRGHAFNKSIT